MLVDALELDPDHVIRADVCIIGAGPAGIAIAMELMDSGLSVALLESGGNTATAFASGLGRPSSDSAFPQSKRVWTTRQFGGNANAWRIDTGRLQRGVRLVELAAADFEPRDGFENMGWPIGPADLAPYYARALRIFEGENSDHDPDEGEPDSDLAFPIEDADVENDMFRFGDGSVFLGEYRRAIAAATNVSLCLNVTALELEAGPNDNAVISVRAASAPGRSIMCRAGTFVIATGGLVAPQLLLQSNRQHPEGLGNGHDLVGRYFMDHPLLMGGELVPFSRDSLNRMSFYDLRACRGKPVMGFLRTSDSALRRGGIANLTALLFPRTRMSDRRERGFKAAQRVRAWSKNRAEVGRVDWLDSVLGIDGVAEQYFRRLVAPTSNLQIGGWSRLPHPDKRFTHFEILHQAEQFPHFDNRVELGDERDALGARRIRIDWRWHEHDREAVSRSQQVMAKEFHRLGIGRFDPITPLDIKTASTAHYMGTTRMHESPRSGVVDARCRVHGVPNLYIASASVFPTGGSANPTLTTVALAIRMADDIRREGKLVQSD